MEHHSTLAWTLILIVCSFLNKSKGCNLVPFESKSNALQPDNRFAIEIEGITNNEFLPGNVYTVNLFATDNFSTFMAFTIGAQGDKKENENNNRVPIQLKPGIIIPSDGDTTRRENCNETAVFEADKEPKKFVTVKWRAPPKGNQCVTIYAYVGVKPDVWYSASGPLSKVVCEDVRKKEDMKPTINHNCNVCEEARYELTFQGTWAYNTHPKIYPEGFNTAKFSDIVGASHDEEFTLFEENKYASAGLKMMAEQGNTTLIEHEILEHLGKRVRTVIKATGPATPLLSSISSFRTSRKYHFISIAASILPSPDWFLGVYKMELCDVGGWLQSYTLNLYPWDAGTDIGTSFGAAPEPAIPATVIASANFPEVPRNNMPPFAKLIVTLIRTYEKPECTSVKENTSTDEDGDDNAASEDNNNEPEEPKIPVEITTSPPIDINIEEGTDECPTTKWGEWQPCDGPCEENKIIGYQSRFRSYIVDGKLKEFSEGEEIPEACMEKSTVDVQECEETCIEEKEEEEEQQE